MKFMKLGSKPDTFFTTEEGTRTVASEVATDLRIQVQNSLYHLHKFPLLSKCLKLQKIWSELKETSEEMIVDFHDVPGGAEAFETCAKFCYGITTNISALNFVPVRCTAEYLQMTDSIDRSNLIGKLDIFFASCLLRRWKDTLVVLQSTRQHHSRSDELGLTSKCIEAIATSISANPTEDWWSKDVSELPIEHFFRIIVAVKASGVVSGKLVGKSLQVYASRRLHKLSANGSNHTKHELLLEKIVSLLPAEKGSVSCSFLLKLLKASNMLNSSPSLKTELARRVGRQLEEATLNDILIPSTPRANKMLYDVDIVMVMVEEFMLQGQSSPTSPPRAKLRTEKNSELEVQDESNSTKLRVAKLVDGYLREIAKDENLPLDKLMALAEAVPDYLRADHDDLYNVIDTYLRAHPGLEKSGRKVLCRILDCKKLSVEACMHAARNELLPLRVVVQVLFFEQSRATNSGSQVSELPDSIKALLSIDTEALKLHGNAAAMDDAWSLSTPKTNLTTLKMKLGEEDSEAISGTQNASSKLRALCSIPNKPKRIISKLLTANK